MYYANGPRKWRLGSPCCDWDCLELDQGNGIRFAEVFSCKIGLVTKVDLMDQLARIKKTDVIKRSIYINGHKTSVSLENEFWQGLREIAGRDRAAITTLVEQIDRARNTCNLSSAIRVFVFNHFRARE